MASGYWPPMSLHSLVKTVFYRLGFTIKRLRPITAKSGPAGKAADPSQIRTMLHAVDPYADFDASRYPLDLQGWGSETNAFHELIQEVKPNLIVEVGTWKGGSAIHMAEEVAKAGLNTQILCIDTWLGGLEFWTEQNVPDRYGSLRLQNGWPQVYYQFLANVCHKGHQQRIIPFPQTSSIGALWLRFFGLNADLIYVDASHEEEDVYADVLNFWEVLAPNGVMFGDDWSWDGVRVAVQRFARENGLEIRFAADKWVLDKPAK
jgi:hypothetical protein